MHTLNFILVKALYNAQNGIKYIRGNLFIETYKKHCIFDHTRLTGCAYPSWSTSKTHSHLYVTDIVFAVSWTSFFTYILIHSRSFTAWNKQIKLQLVITSFNTLFYVNLIKVCARGCMLKLHIELSPKKCLKCVS